MENCFKVIYKTCRTVISKCGKTLDIFLDNKFSKGFFEKYLSAYLCSDFKSEVSFPLDLVGVIGLENSLKIYCY